MDRERNFIFPEGFLWGSATSAFQVEGDCTNHDFYEWALRGKIKDGSSPVDAVHFWKYYKKDISLMKKMNHSAARIGLEWARIEPKKGQFDDAALMQYRDILGEMRKQGISTMVTLHHFSNPRWLSWEGGWTRRSIVDYFKRYAEKVVRFIGDLVDQWITINEPSVYAFFAYLYGEFPPGKKSLSLSFRVMKNMALAHKSVYESILKIHWEKKWKEPEIGIAKHLRTFDAFREKNLFDRVSTALVNKYFNNYFLDLINSRGRTMHFLGINYYSGDLVQFPMILRCRNGLPKNKLGWDIYPQGFYRVLKEYFQRYKMPLYITENGTCDDHDEIRPRFILDHVYQMYRAIQDGVDIAAYYHWSTMDNFELVDGISARFGLVHVDHLQPGRTRRIKKSGELYGKIAEENGITTEIVEEYVQDWTPGKSRVMESGRNEGKGQ